MFPYLRAEFRMGQFPQKSYRKSIVEAINIVFFFYAYELSPLTRSQPGKSYSIGLRQIQKQMYTQPAVFFSQ